MRRKFNLLDDLMKESQELGIGIDKKDQVSVVNSIQERHGILTKLATLQEEITETLHKIGVNEGKVEKKRVTLLLRGRGSPLNKKEEALLNQAVEKEKRYHEVLELDERLNRHLKTHAKANS